MSSEHTTDRISQDELRRLHSHNLADEAVRFALAGYLAAELRHIHGVNLPGGSLIKALDQYVDAVAMLGDAATIAINTGFRSPQ